MGTLQEDLLALGADADEVAGKLLALGIKGDAQEADSCPIYNYLHYMGHTLVTGVDEDDIFLSDGMEGSYPTTEAVSDFIHGFDRGEYPSLETEVSPICQGE